MTAFNQMEFRVLDWVVQTFRSDMLDFFAPKVSFLANAGWIWILIALLFMIRKSTRKTGLAVALALVFSFVVADILLKPLVARARPFEIKAVARLLIPVPNGFSFPSGHAQASFAAASAIHRKWKAAGAVALLLAALISFSRLYLYVHFPGDVLAGMVIGYTLGCMADAIVSGLRYRYNAKRRKGRSGRRVRARS